MTQIPQTGTPVIKLPAELPPIPHATTDEKLIVGKLVTDLLAAGFKLSVNDGGDETVTDSADAAVIFAALSSTDADSLYVLKDGKQEGWVYLVWGNDAHVISDYTTNLEGLMAGADALSTQLGG